MQIKFELNDLNAWMVGEYIYKSLCFCGLRLYVRVFFFIMIFHNN